MGFFESPRERIAPEMFSGNIGEYDQLLRSIINNKSQFQNVNNLGDVQSRFGISPFNRMDYQKQVGSVFSPLKQNLATANADARKRAVSKYGTRGTPEFLSAGVDAQFAGERNNLQSQEAGAGLAGFDKERESNWMNANFLKDILSQRDQFGQNKFNQRLAGLSGKTGAIGNYVNSLSNASTFDDILSLGGTAAKFFKA
jgi:hypothetical protein